MRDKWGQRTLNTEKYILLDISAYSWLFCPKCIKGAAIKTSASQGFMQLIEGPLWFPKEQFGEQFLK